MGEGKAYAVSGIDTDVGKTILTGLLARQLIETGRKVITIKPVQTGCVSSSEDIVQHRQMMGTDLLKVDREGLTCPYLFSTPCSPHLAAKLEGTSVDTERITDCVEQLVKMYDIVLIEGAGGLFVPLNEQELSIDYFCRQQWPVILVTSARLGSINHTLASLEALKNRGMQLSGIVYNTYGQENMAIVEDTYEVVRSSARSYGFTCPVVRMWAQSSYGKDKRAASLVEVIT